MNKTLNQIAKWFVGLFSNPVSPEKGDFIQTARFFASLCLASFVFILIGRKYPEIGTALIWSVAALAAGSLFGFLFGIPKVLQSGEALKRSHNPQDQSETYRQQVNTNLTEISDWITKIIVGLGLVNLKDLPRLILKAGEIIGREINGPTETEPAVALGIGITVGFGTIGFLFGYLSTRMYVASALAKADRNAMQAEQKVESNTAQIDSLRADLNFMKSRLSLESTEETKPQVTEELTGSHPPHPSFPSVEDMKEAIRLADLYCNIDHPNRLERVRLKDHAADEIAKFCILKKIPREWLATEGINRSNDGLIISLATIIHADPKANDLSLLANISDVAKTNHTRYRITIAIGRTYYAGLAPDSLFSRISNILIKFYSQGDRSLKKNVRQTSSLVSEIAGEKISFPPEE